MRIASSSAPRPPAREDWIPMRSGPLPALLALLRTVARTSALALAALLVAGAAPAGAVTIECAAFSGTCFFDQDYVADPGHATVPGSFPNSSTAEGAFQTLIGAGNFDTESFEGFADKDAAPLNIFQGGALSLIGMLSDPVADGRVRLAPLDDAVNRGFPTDGSLFWKNETTSDASNELFRVAFKDALGVSDVGVRSFGFYATAWSTQSTVGATDLVLDLFLSGGGTTTINIPHSENGNLAGSAFYFAVISDLPFIAAALRNESITNPGDRIGFDDFTVAIVPEPSTGLLLFAGLLGLATTGRRRSA
jgi:hypothetical protein